MSSQLLPQQSCVDYLEPPFTWRPALTNVQLLHPEELEPVMVATDQREIPS